MSGDNEELKQALQAAIDSWPSKPWLGLPGPTDISPGLVTHLLAALQTGGWELVKLPKADGPDGGGQYSFDCGTVSTVTATPNDDGSWSVWDHDFDMDSEDARLLAAALVAAAAAAEREANHG